MDLIGALIECGAVKFGDFTLKSGRRSQYYIDIKVAETKWEILNEICDRILPFVYGNKLAGVELGAIPIVVGVALKSNKDYIIIRKERKDYGTARRYEGTIERGDKFTIIEDVVTTASSVLRAAEIIEEEGGIVENIVAVVDREEGGRENIENRGYEFNAIITVEELLKRR